MGMIRKTLSMTSGGIVDFRSDKERIARSSRQTAQEMKRQRKLMEKDQTRQSPRAGASEPSSPRHSAPKSSEIDATARLLELGKMKESGLLSDEEFAKAKATLLKSDGRDSASDSARPSWVKWNETNVRSKGDGR